jgi:hypothetical protein
MHGAALSGLIPRRVPLDADVSGHSTMDEDRVCLGDERLELCLGYAALEGLFQNDPGAGSKQFGRNSVEDGDRAAGRSLC